MNWQLLRHAVISAMLFITALFILSTEEKLDDGRPSAEEHPRWQVNRVQIQVIRCTKHLTQRTAVSHAASFCVSGGVKGAPSCCSDHLYRPHLTLMSGS